MQIRNIRLLIALAVLIPFVGFSLPDPGDTDFESLLSEIPEAKPADSTKVSTRIKWAFQALDSMSLDEKIGQLFMIPAYSNKDAAHVKEVMELVEKHKVGGLIFMQGSPGKQVNLANKYQKAARFPLLISQDAEWGLAMRLDSTVRFPKNMTLGAIRDSMILMELGMEIGRECRRVGVQVNFAPVVDVNNNPLNPVINDRSYGEDRFNVATKGYYFYKGMEYARCIGCVKHFPGHGDTDTDSHKDLPIIPFSRERLDSLELYPFKKLFSRGVASTMIAHLYIPALDTTTNLASTLSPRVVDTLLKQDLGFNGLIFTDALRMQGVAKFWDEGEVDLKALLAGNDVLLFSKDVPKAANLIREAIKAGKFSKEELDRRVLKILVAKEWAGLHKNRFVKGMKGDKSLLGIQPTLLRKNLYRQAMTLVKNEGGIFPLPSGTGQKIAVVEVGGATGAPTAFARTLGQYVDFDHFGMAPTIGGSTADKLYQKLKAYDLVIFGVDKMSKRASAGFGIKKQTTAFLKKLKTVGKTKIAVTLFGSPYAVKYFPKYEDALLVAYENVIDAKSAAAEAIAGAIKINGQLPVSSGSYQFGTGLEIDSPQRLLYTTPEDAGMDSKTLKKIDKIANAAIKQGATPGCAILIARGNKVVYEKGFGRTEYGKSGKRIRPKETIYDLASVTKIASTTLATMRLIGEGKIKLEESVSAYLSDFRGKNMSHIRVRNLLQHNAGFKSWIPFWKETYDSTGTGLRKDIYADEPNEKFCLPVTEGMYVCIDYQDSLWLQIRESKIKTDKKVRYSDLSMIVMGKIIEKVTGVTLDQYVDSVFYQPMGLQHTAYLPAKNLKGETFPPTEQDDYWRKTKVQGYVHDQASAIMGGVAGHAGLFSTTSDLAQLMYMLLNEGRFGGKQYLDPGLIKAFTAYQLSSSRKGLGFDKPPRDTTKSCPTAKVASKSTFGHLGFTGIGVWVDPEYDLIYIFLSNRTWPKSNNKKLMRENIRPEIHDVAYKAIKAFEKQALLASQ